MHIPDATGRFCSERHFPGGNTLESIFRLRMTLLMKCGSTEFTRKKKGIERSKIQGMISKYCFWES